MLLLISGVIFLTIFTLFYVMLATYAPHANQVSLRLKSLEIMTAAPDDYDEKLAEPFAQRVISPLAASLAAGLGRMTPAAVRRLVAEKLTAAGGFAGLGTDAFLLWWGCLIFAFPAIAVTAASVLEVAAGSMAEVAAAALALGAAWPLLLLNKRIAARKASIQRDLPDVLDLLTVSVEAGLSFDGALAKLSEKMDGPLVEEFARVLQEIRVGVTRREALHAMGRRCDVPDLSLFTSALVQADQLGVSIGNVLRVQSAGMRDKRRQQAQAQAMKAPVKMLLPLVLCIFPTLFVILLGPAVIQIATSFTTK